MSKDPSSPRGRPLGVIFLIVFIDLVGFSIIFPLFPAMLEWYLGREGDGSLIGQLVGFIERLTPGSSDLFLTTVLFGGILGSLYSLLQFAFAPIWGRLSDRFGRRPILLVTVAGTAVSYVVWIFSRDFTVLLVARTLGGIMAGNIAVATAAVADVTTAADRSKGMGLIGLAFGLGFIIGPAIGGLGSLFPYDGTHPGATAWALHPFSFPAACAAVLAAFNWLWVWRSFPETRPTEPAGMQPFRRGWFTFRQVDNRAIGHAVVVYFVLLVAFSAMEFTLTFLAVERLGYSPRELILVFVFVGFVLAFTQGWFVRRYASRIGEVKCVIGGLVCGIFGLLALAYANEDLLFFTGLAFLGVGIGLTSPTLSALVSLYAPDHAQGKNLGAFRSAGSLARAVGPLLGAVFYWSNGSTNAYLAGAVGILAALLIAWFLPSPTARADQ